MPSSTASALSASLASMLAATKGTNPGLWLNGGMSAVYRRGTFRRQDTVDPFSWDAIS